MKTYPQLALPTIQRDNVIPICDRVQARFQLVKEVQEWL